MRNPSPSKLHDSILLLTPIKAARALSISRSLLYGLIMQNRIFSIKIGGARRIPRQALHEYVASLCDSEK
jgi:excisionase family DNA binding protein